VPALVYAFGMSQHRAQGTSLATWPERILLCRQSRRENRGGSADSVGTR
jgi:hypothetical protein